MNIKTGDKAPAFTLDDQNGKTHSLLDYEGKWVLVYFYPKDDTPGCTKEACTIRDQWSDFKKIDAVVLGISGDSVASHAKFVEKYQLPFTLLSDLDRSVVEAYDSISLKKMFGKEYKGIMRNSFLIDPQGKIAKIYLKVEPKLHAGEVLTDIKELTA